MGVFSPACEGDVFASAVSPGFKLFISGHSQRLTVEKKLGVFFCDCKRLHVASDCRTAYTRFASKVRQLVTYRIATGTAPTPTPTTGTTPAPTPTQSAGSSCSVHYAITNQWNTGFGASFVITNTGSTAINGWSLKFSFLNGQTITQLWNGSYTQSGSAVTITNLSYNASIPPGSSLSSEPGFHGTWNGTTNSPPTAFTLNGVACSVV